MASPVTKSDEILDAAEGLARSRGYNGFSFRDLAVAVGIKSASVHYHFPTKGDLGAAVAHRYADRFFQALGPPDPPARTGELLDRYVAAFRSALGTERRICLCGMLGAEVASLPDAVAAVVRGFFEKNVEWLEAALSRGNGDGSRQQALLLLAALEGAMILARTLDSTEVFDTIAAGALKNLATAAP